MALLFSRAASVKYDADQADPIGDHSMAIPKTVTLCECWARDGLQSIPRVVSTADKVELINRIIDSGVRKLEVTR